ncbi:MAG: tRNA (adenosine(37)-N6)-threonylcarbamoyltransferase complex dimerization subunit type 1 TsaB [Lachnospiraceae bacterium]|nr:tRNA (adenosine(37)-N6)-threonylcarbamoyltransferase complex dimerization subunit type 1 TsaB [Lachnospiraceae bacterium]
MILLAIDSSGLTATAAVNIDGVIVSYQAVNNKKTHSQTLLPMIEDVMVSAGIDINQVDAIAIAEGPGSFTGLRIGAATVKGLGLATGKPIIPVSTLEGLAYNMAGCKGVICPIMDARRNQVYTALFYYNPDSEQMVQLAPSEAIGIEELIARNIKYDEITFVGDGVPVFREYLTEQLGEKAHFAMPHMRLQSAASISVAASFLWKEKKYVSAKEFEPVYLRLSQAEREKLEAKRNNKG